ncbi:MAG: adenosylcobinamide-GDP ribazoletransferase [Actinomycetota bacterium]|nr:adenosylcobinamide-GDP ribazoletransferase [Actinomycetota bacterium]
MRDALRLAFGTLTVLRVRPPSAVDRRVAGWAMALGPMVGAVLGSAGLALAWVSSQALHPLLVAVLVVALLGWATRLIHWDGLADTADGLGSGRPAEAALEVMRRSDIGPFGVFTVLAVFAVQVAALAELLTADGLVAGYAPLGSRGLLVSFDPPAAAGGLGAVVAAPVLGRCALLVACRSGVPAARRDGLGAPVVGSVGAAQLAAGLVVAAGALLVAAVVGGGLTPVSVLLAAGVSAVWAVAATTYLRRRLGGMTGDTLGALVETTTAVALVVLAGSV